MNGSGQVLERARLVALAVVVALGAWVAAELALVLTSAVLGSLFLGSPTFVPASWTCSFLVLALSHRALLDLAPPLPFPRAALAYAPAQQWRNP